MKRWVLVATGCAALVGCGSGENASQQPTSSDHATTDLVDIESGFGIFHGVLQPATAYGIHQVVVVADEEWSFSVSYSDGHGPLSVKMTLAYDEQALVEYLVSTGEVADEAGGRDWLVTNCTPPVVNAIPDRSLGWVCDDPSIYDDNPETLTSSISGPVTLVFTLDDSNDSSPPQPGDLSYDFDHGGVPYVLTVLKGTISDS